MASTRFRLILCSFAVSGLLLFQNCGRGLTEIAQDENSQGVLRLPTEPGPETSALAGDQSLRPLELFPDAQSLLPKTTGSFTESVPDTLDLAERAKSYLQGATQSLLAQQDYAPGGPAIFNSTIPGEEITYYEKVNDTYVSKKRPVCWNVFPCIENDQVQNWGKVAVAMYLARRMSNYDANDQDQTLSAQLLSMRAMVDENVNLRIAQRGGHPALQFLTYDQESSITPTTLILEALSEMQQLQPTSARKAAIDELVKRHKKSLRAALSGGKHYYFFWNQPEAIQESEQGTTRTYQAFIQGRALYAMSRWRNASGDAEANFVVNVLQDYLLSYNNSEFWSTPDASKYPAEAGQYVGHMHGYLGAVNGILEYARPLKATNPAAFNGYAKFAKEVYDFTKKRNRTGPVGHFGEIGTTGDMIRLALLLTELGISDEWEDIDAWTRNTLAEAQIDDQIAAHIPNLQNSNEGWVNVGAKSKGLFLSDATHVFSIPLNKNFRYNVDGPSNAMRAMYEVWKKSVVFNGNFAAVNLLLNRSTRFFEVKSHIPYRGRVEIVSKSSVGPITQLGVRLPTWGLGGLKISESGQSLIQGSATAGDWYFLPGTTYAVIKNFKPGHRYVVDFDLPVYEQPVFTLRGDQQFWYEGSYPTTGAGAEQVTTYTGSFRGNTLVDVRPRPAGGIARFQRLQFKNFDGSLVTPMKTVTRSPLQDE